MATEESAKEQSTMTTTDTRDASTTPKLSHGLRFWGIFSALCLLAFISALDVAVITTALPKITADIGSAQQEYIWIANSFVLASAVIQPLIGQLADIFGRRSPLIIATGLFALGSGIAGGAHDVPMLIAGRTVQGLGAGGVYVLLDIVCCDLVPLRERGKYVGLMNAWAGVAAGIGPVVGGILADTNWRWIFYMNLPICAVALAVVLIFMHVKTGGSRTEQSKLKQVDWIGNIIFIPSMISLLFGLITGGIQHPWSSWRIILPLVLGILGWIAFHVQQSLPCTRWPSVPARLFSNRTSACAYVLTFLASILIQSVCYFLPVWFQAVLGSTVLQSGVKFLPFAIGALFFAIVGGVLLSKFGSYRPLHAAAFGLSAIGFGLFTVLISGTTTSAARWVTFQLIASAGIGITQSTLLPAIMAGLAESDVAASAAVYSFIRTFGFIWGVTMPSIIFNAMINRDIHLLSSDAIREQLRDGAAYSFASQIKDYRDELGQQGWNEVITLYNKSLNVIWWVSLGISIAALAFVAGERHLELRNELDTEYGIDAEKKPSQPSSP